VSELILKKDEYYEFAHNLFQSYLIALEIKRLKQENLLKENWEQNLWYEACIMYATLLINPTDFIVHFYNQDNPKAQGLAERCYRELPVRKRRGLEFLEQKRQTSLFTQLETYLKNGQWREADQETARLMLLIVGKETDEVLYEDEINTLPCDELLTIDQLWKKYSNGHFGFSIQLQIMSKYGELPERYDWDNYVIFAEELGWHQKDGTKRGKWLNYDEISFNLDSPMGHLPLAKSVFLEGYAAGRWHFFSRAETCNL
jgi:predicted NACHT family NTPase